MKCPKCFVEGIIIETPNYIHFAKESCPLCEKWLRWISAPNEDGKRKKISKHKLESVTRYYKLTKPICFFCLREENQLGLSETLTRDHIVELQIGGKDEINNIQILCSACHKLKNWVRLYMNWHLKKEDENGEDT